MITSSDKEQFDFKGRFSKEWEEIRKEIKKVSILVMGGTGTGKSTLVNCVFKKDIAKAGAGRPVTRGIDLYENDYLRVYDSEGYESGDQNQSHYNQLIKKFLDEKAASVNTDVHLVWYCVSTPSARFTDLDVEFINTAVQKYKKSLCVVLTKIDIGTEEQFEALTKAIKDPCPNIPVFASSIEEIPIKNGLDALDQWSREQLDKSLRESFMSVSNRDLEAKESEGEKIVRQHVTGAFAVGFSPIPFSDAPLLIANQMGLLVRICLLWDMASLKQFIVASSAVEMVMAQIGKTLVSSLLKLIPGIGTLIGGVISGTVAAGLTFALGTAVNKLCRKILEDQLAGKIIPFAEYINEDFLDTIRTQYNQYEKQRKEYPV